MLLLHHLPATLHGLLTTLALFYHALATYYMGTRLRACTTLDPASRLWVYSLAKTLHMLENKHYRASTFSTDIRANFKNVAIPGTGIPMNLFFHNQVCAWLFICVVYPVVALAAALYTSLLHRSERSLTDSFKEQLLCPKHWFALWRLNSWLVAWHAMATGEMAADQYGLENKGAFLLEAQAKGIPISPVLSGISCLFAKHVNMEGGLGIHVLRNFTQGGEWILQPALSNSPELARLLPPGAPLSTLRVITVSRHWLKAQRQPVVHDVRASALMDGDRISASVEEVSVMSVVLRAGRAGALTDHNCICFGVDKVTGQLLPGKSNQHWYKLGPQHVWRLGETYGKEWVTHPDQPAATQIAGRRLPNMQSICSLCIDAHTQMLPDVPIIGWDVALTAEHGPVLLELNISCNFFLGQVPFVEYVAFMSEFVTALEQTKAT